MINIKKGKAPGYLQSPRVDLAIEKLEDFYRSKNRSQRRYEFPFNPEIDQALKSNLHRVFYGKCGYCETKIDGSQNGVVDRYRPHDGVRDKTEYFQDLYWWLAFDWENLIYSCKECNQYKANYFPIKGKRVLNKTSDLNKEKRMLLNPCLDDPFNHIGQGDGELYSLTDEGYQTIELLNLNRTNLVNNRKKGIYELKAILDKILYNIKTVSPRDLDYINQIIEKEPHIEFLLVKYHIILQEISQNKLLRKIIDSENYESDLDFDLILKKNNSKIKDKDIIKSDYFPLEYIHIKNFKSVTDLRIDFPLDTNEERSWLFILGENGVGKSSILQALALGIKSTIKNDDSIIPSLIQKNKQKAEIIIKERNNDNIITTTLKRKEKTITQVGNFNSFLLGYGSLRLASEDGLETKQNLKSISYENLFSPIKSLNDFTFWLKGIFKSNRPLFDSIAYSIKQLLPHDLKDNQLTVLHNDIIFENSEIPFTSFSDGYKSTITLAIDIMMKLASGHADMNKISGIVIIDELGNQLHPRWQMRIVSQLRSVFPKITFIISTHHPLCLRGSKFGEIVLLKSIENKVEAITKLPDPSELRVDQILSSEYFGLNSLIDPELEAKFNRYYKLLSLQSDISKKEIIELDELTDLLRSKKHLGNSLREELMYSVIDNLLAKEVIFSKTIPNRETLKTEVIDRVKEIWSKLNIEINDQS